MRYDVFVSYSHASDSLLSERVQEGLQRFAKPWWRRRSLSVFRDQTGLTANPGLWSSIAEGMDESRHFVLLASPNAVLSDWVAREVEYWIANRPPETLSIVLTDGEVAWDWQARDFDWARSSAVPVAMSAYFAEEPRHIDMRWARSEVQLDLTNGRFRDQIAELAAPIHGMAKDDLTGEDVRQHRRTIRTAWLAGTALLLLTAAAVVTSITAIDRADAANHAKGQLDATNQELEATNERLLTTNQELDARKQELQATNERLDATNQDLDQANGELDEKNQELEATNDELRTTNHELDERKQELEHTNETLDATNQELDQANGELDERNQELEATNKELSIANQALRISTATIECRNAQLTAEKEELARRTRELARAALAIHSAIELTPLTPGMPSSDPTQQLLDTIADLEDKVNSYEGQLKNIRDNLAPYLRYAEVGAVIDVSLAAC
jgi:predicted  nucleic acid-binding Zn-ribbon protein